VLAEIYNGVKTLEVFSCKTIHGVQIRVVDCLVVRNKGEEVDNSSSYLLSKWLINVHQRRPQLDVHSRKAFILIISANYIAQRQQT
jgi:hypothetical protein